MSNSSKSKRGGYIINGNNHKVNTKEKLEEYVKKGYNAECGSGFYCIEDIDIAEKYAIETAKQYGGKPYLNFYRIDHQLIKRDLKTAYFNSIEDPRTLEYLGGNISGSFPKFCKLDNEKTKDKTPSDLCYFCGHDCIWSADYIEAVLSDATYNLDNILIDFWNKKVDYKETLKRIYEAVDEEDDVLRMQIVLRNKILDIDNFDYLKFVQSVVIDNVH